MNNNLIQLLQQREDIASKIKPLIKERKRLTNAISQARHREKNKINSN